MEDYVGIVRKALKEVMSRDKTIAIKDLTLCHRKKVFSVINPVEMTDEEFYNYVSGQAAHDVIQKLFMVYPERFRAEKEIRYKNVRGRIDILDTELNKVVDAKISRVQKPLFKPFKFHEQQIRNYMAIQNSDEGQIIYQLNNHARFQAFPISMTAEERINQLKKMEKEAELLQKAIEAEDPSLVGGVYEDPQLKWVCEKCPYLEKCRSMRT